MEKVGKTSFITPTSKTKGCFTFLEKQAVKKKLAGGDLEPAKSVFYALAGNRTRGICLEGRNFTTKLQALGTHLRSPGIEPEASAWKAEILPLNYKR
jgi:hypothetical protein